MKKFRSGLEKISRAIQYVPMVVTMFAVIITVIDIILKLTTNYRVLGNMEIVQLSQVVMMFLCYGITQLENGHVRVDLFVNKFPPKVRCVFNAALQFVCAIFCFLMMIQSFKMIPRNMAAGTSSSVLHIPYAPFSFIMGVGFALYVLAIIVTALEYCVELPHAKPIEQ